MLLSKKITIFQWILLLIFYVSDSAGKKYYDSDYESYEPLPTHIHVVKNTDIRKPEKHIKNNIAVRGHLIQYPRNKDVNDYSYKSLVKRIVPHGYTINSLEYDDKYKTLYKPLVRIHKRKADADDTHNDKSDNKYDLIYLLDNDQNEDITNLKRDNELFKPFSIDNMDIKYLPSDETRYYEGNEKYTGISNLNRYELGDRILQLSSKKIPISNEKEQDNNEFVAPHGRYIDSLTGSYEPQINLINNVLNRSELNINKLLDQKGQTRYKRTKTQDKDKKYIPEPLKSQWFGTVGQLVSKHFQIMDTKKLKRDQLLRSGPKKKELIVLIKNMLQDLNQEGRNHKYDEPKTMRNMYEWFVPMGQLTSKQLSRKERLHEPLERSIEDSKSKSHFTFNKNNVPKSINELWQTGKKLDLKHYKTIQGEHNTKYDANEISDVSKWFGSIGGSVPKQKEVERSIESHTETKSNKFSLLDQITRLRANTIKKEKEKVHEKVKEIEKNLRMIHAKSGEDVEMDPYTQTFWNYDESTTEKTTSMLPHYPFWNYWTYEKTLHQDVCKGQTILDGGICIGTPH